MKEISSIEKYLLKTYNNEFPVFVRYFVDCYLIQGVDFVNLAETVSYFKEQEKNHMVNGLRRETLLLKEKGDMEFVKSIVKKHAMRNLKGEKPKIFIETILKILD